MSLQAIKELVTPRKNSNKKRKLSAREKAQKERHVNAIQGSTSQTSSQSDIETENEIEQYTMTSSPGKTQLDPANFVEVLNLALEHDTIANKMTSLFKPLLEKRDQEIDMIKADLICERQKNAELTARVCELEQYTRTDSIIISGIPETTEETNPQCEQKVIEIIKSIGVDITSSDISISHRLRPQKRGPRNVIVKLVTHKMKIAIMVNKKKLQSSRSSKPIYINEALSPMRSKLFFDVRNAIKEKKLDRNVWTKEGKILIRNRENTKTVQIHELADLDNI